MTPHAQHPVRHHTRQRGTAYLLVLSITSLLVVLGLSATQIARGQMQRNALHEDQAKARLAAQYTQDYLHKLLSGNSTWRNNAQNNTWAFFTTFDGTQVFFSFADPIDGDITGDYTQPFRMYTMAIHGDSRRMYSVEYVPDDAFNLTRNVATWRQETLAD